ncbi:MAG: PAS domain S-box protein, partial [Candidatus Hydrogenedentes bacterium]|nr:PAS domain S-box protein [Candidatus Hydrogenedentota bacterium]
MGLIGPTFQNILMLASLVLVFMPVIFSIRWALSRPIVRRLTILGLGCQLMNIAFDIVDDNPSVNGYWLFNDENPVHIITQELFAAAAISFLCSGLYYFIVSSWTSEASLASERDLLRGEVEERRRVEQALQQEKHFTDAMLDSLPGIFYLLDEQGRFLRWNKNAEEVLGYSPDEIARMNALDFFGEDGKQTVSKAMQKVFVEGFASVEATLAAKDGSRRPYLFTGTRIMIGDKLHLLGTGIDISQRILAEEVRRQHSEALRQTLDGIAIADLDGIIQFVNPAWAAMHGYSPEELEGKHLSVFHTSEQIARDLNPFLEILRENGSHLGEVNHVKKDGVVFPTWMSATIVRDKHDAPRSMIAMARDISQQRNLEAQLGQAQKMESVGRLAGGVAHDFNNLLMAILGYAEMILTDSHELNPGVREWIEEIKKAGERARDLTRQLLAFGRKQTLEMKVLDLNDVVVGFGKMLKRLIGEDIQVQTLLNPRIGSVEADPAQIEQVLLNLAVNARDAMPNGGRLTIETADAVLDDAYAATHPYVEPGTYVMLSVTDTGCGMSVETQKTVFEPFFTTKGPGEGTGLGLATVYGIVKQHRGYISVYSELDQGTTF